ncbi:MAG: tetratricopeptide repeat protein [Thermoanaerobaculia bacterium]
MNRFKGPFTFALLFGALAAMGATSSSPYLDQALATQEALAATEPHNAEVLNDLGNLLALAGENERAEEAYRRALELEPGNAKTRYNLALMLQEEGQRKQAIVEFRQVIELEPNDAWAHYQLGRCYEEARKRSLAIEEYARAFDLDSSLASPRVNPHIIENRMATEALLVAYTTDERIAGQAPRMYEEPARIAEILTPPVPVPEEEPVEEEVQTASSSVRRVTVQPQADDGSRMASATTETPNTLESQNPIPATATGAATPSASDADVAASRRAMIQRRLAAQAAVQQTAGGDSPEVTSPPPTAISQEEAQPPEESEPETAAPPEEPAEDDPPEQEEFEPGVPSTGQGGTRVTPAPYQPGAPSTGRLELELIPTRQDQLGAG